MQTRLAKQTTESIVLTTYQHFLHTLTHQGEKRKLCFNSDPLLATAGVSLKVEAMQLTADAASLMLQVLARARRQLPPTRQQ
jgi:hypothetical protein